MDTIAAGPSTAKSDRANDDLSLTNVVGIVQDAGAESLNVETLASNPLLPTDSEMGHPVQIRRDRDNRSRYERLWEGLVFRVLRQLSSSPAQSPIRASPHLLQRHASRCPADPNAVRHCVSSRPYRPSRERGRRYY